MLVSISSFCIIFSLISSVSFFVTILLSVNKLSATPLASSVVRLLDSAYYRNELGISKHIGTYGNGYLIQWARTIPNTKAMLLELPQVNSHNQLLNMNLSGKFINATMRILENF